MPNRKYSKILHDGPQQAASRSMLRGAGFKDEDFEKSIVGIASLGASVTPCNMHLNSLAEIVEESVNNSGCKALHPELLTDSSTISASEFRCILHGVTLAPSEAIPTIDFSKSSSLNPAPRNIDLDAACCGPSCNIFEYFLFGILI